MVKDVDYVIIGAGITVAQWLMMIVVRAKAGGIRTKMMTRSSAWWLIYWALY